METNFKAGQKVWIGSGMQRQQVEIVIATEAIVRCRHASGSESVTPADIFAKLAR